MASAFASLRCTKSDLFLISQTGIADGNVQLSGASHAFFRIRIGDISYCRRSLGYDNHVVDFDVFHDLKGNLLADPRICGRHCLA